MLVILVWLSEVEDMGAKSLEVGLPKTDGSLLTGSWPKRRGRLVLLAVRPTERSGDGNRHWAERERAAGRSEGDRSIARHGGPGMLDAARRYGCRRHQSGEITRRRRRAPDGTADNFR